ncbi:MAG: aminodeoxychorismate synthase component I, partial [Deltaproteobacteria bacterium]
SMLGDKKRLKIFIDALRGGTGHSPQSGDISVNPAAAAYLSNFTRQEYINAVNAAKGYIAAGDIYQINLSQRLEIQWEGDPFRLYSTLVEKNPAPFSSFLDLKDFQILSCSPERLLKISGDMATTMPIKGTRPRGKTPDEDKKFLDELKSSGKEAAEHVMIVDLERNDLGAICEAGTIEVPEFGGITAYPHLYHMVSTVRGRLNKGINSIHALKKIFPGGSVTGAPKIRAMEIIDELEKAPRGVYTGGIGWAGFNGAMDMSMAIRTAIFRGDVMRLSVGGGIVADSVPEHEYSETLLKASDFFRPLGIKD